MKTKLILLLRNIFPSLFERHIAILVVISPEELVVVEKIEDEKEQSEAYAKLWIEKYLYLYYNLKVIT